MSRRSRAATKMSNSNTRKSCVVPKCTTTTTNSPQKLFFTVPKDVPMRKKWIEAMRRLDAFADKSTVYCCEDHFDIENDMENYIKYKLVGGRLKLKPGTLPHKFKCQEKKEVKPERSAVHKSKRIKHFEKLLIEDLKKLEQTSKSQKPEVTFIPSYEVKIEIEDPLSFENNDHCFEISQKSKGVQANLKAKRRHKSTMTDNKYVKKEKKIIFSPDAATVRSRNDTSSNASSHTRVKAEHCEHCLCLSRTQLAPRKLPPVRRRSA